MSRKEHQFPLSTDTFWGTVWLRIRVGIQITIVVGVLGVAWSALPPLSEWNFNLTVAAFSAVFAISDFVQLSLMMREVLACSEEMARTSDEACENVGLANDLDEIEILARQARERISAIAERGRQEVDRRRKFLTITRLAVLVSYSKERIESASKNALSRVTLPQMELFPDKA
jgi:hypothetical protein